MSEAEAIEIELLLEGVFRRYGFDFRQYARASLRRRVLARVEAEGLRTVSGLQERALHDPECFERLLGGLTVHVTSLFRDPGFFAALRDKVVPLLRTYPFARIWHAGCSTGEEVYSMAILLEEEGLYDRCRIYATDLSEEVLRTARAGVYPLGVMQGTAEAYTLAGGKAALSEYYTAGDDAVILRRALARNVVFAPHSLVTDGSFNEFHLVVCRNVLIYFDAALQARAIGLLHESLARLGVLALGRAESLRLAPQHAAYAALDDQQRLYRRLV